MRCRNETHWLPGLPSLLEVQPRIKDVAFEPGFIRGTSRASVSDFPHYQESMWMFTPTHDPPST